LAPETVRYEIWIVAGQDYVLDHPEDIDALPGDVMARVLDDIPTDQALRVFVASHRHAQPPTKREAPPGRGTA
jgi:hypothetical protein